MLDSMSPFQEAKQLTCNSTQQRGHLVWHLIDTSASLFLIRACQLHSFTVSVMWLLILCLEDDDDFSLSSACRHFRLTFCQQLLTTSRLSIVHISRYWNITPLSRPASSLFFAQTSIRHCYCLVCRVQRQDNDGPSFHVCAFYTGWRGGRASQHLHTEQENYFWTLAVSPHSSVHFDFLSCNFVVMGFVVFFPKPKQISRLTHFYFTFPAPNGRRLAGVQSRANGRINIALTFIRCT